MAKFPCPSCGKTLNVGDQYAGKKVRCPACQGVLVVPQAALPEVAAEEPVEVTPVAPSRRPARPPVRDEDDDGGRPVRRPADDYDDRPRRRPRDDDEDDNRPRRRRYRRGEEWAPCPHCGCPDATRIHWTFWGSWLGPMIINQVRCNECGTNYNGVHGDYNGGRIAIFVVLRIVLTLVILAVIIVAAVIANSS